MLTKGCAQRSPTGEEGLAPKHTFSCVQPFVAPATKGCICCPLDSMRDFSEPLINRRGRRRNTFNFNIAASGAIQAGRDRRAGAGDWQRLLALLDSHS